MALADYNKLQKSVKTAYFRGLSSDIYI